MAKIAWLCICLFLGYGVLGTLAYGQAKSSVVMANGLPGKVGPRLTEAQKLELRTAQVKTMQAMQDLQNTPAWKTYQETNKVLTDLLLKFYKEDGITPDKYTLDDQLNFVPVKEEKK